jgi:hypothetical protein
MRLIIDTTVKTMIREDGIENRAIDLYSKKAFELISQQWLKVGWDQKYSYTFTWLGRRLRAIA